MRFNHPAMSTHTPVEKMTDEKLFDEIRHQVNLSRNTTQGHDRELTRKLAKEANKRGFNLRKTPQ